MKLRDIRPPFDEMRLLLESGFVLRAAGRFDEAADVFRGVHELLPEADVPLVALGSLAFQKGDFAAAQNYCEEALRRQPASLYARLHRAEALLMRQQQEEAVTELQAIVAADHTSPHSRTAQALLDAAHLFDPA